MKTIGLSYMAYWGDQFEDIASGNNFFMADLVFELYRHGYEVYSLQKDLDEAQPIFKNFLVNDRRRAYDILNFTYGTPDLDILLVEWRWRMDGRNWNGPEGRDSVPMDDYYRQLELLTHYHDNTNTKILIMDSDHKMTDEDIARWNKATILSFDLYPKHTQAKYIYWPFDGARLFDREFMVHAPWSFSHDNTYSLDPNFMLSYIGNNYERDEEFEHWLGNISKRIRQHGIHVYGNWLKYPTKATEIQKKYSKIMFHPKVTKAEMEYIYSRSLAVPLLAKNEYNVYGHMTHRLLETMYCGTIPIAFSTFKGIEKYVIPDLIIDEPEDAIMLMFDLLSMSLDERKELWKRQVEHFQYGPNDFIRTLETA